MIIRVLLGLLIIGTLASYSLALEPLTNSNTQTIAQTQTSPQIDLAPELLNSNIQTLNQANSTTLSNIQSNSAVKNTASIAPSATVEKMPKQRLNTAVANDNTEAVQRYLALNFESLIMKGDIHFEYQIPSKADWTTVIKTHLNPHPTHSTETGIAGLSAGGRLFFEDKQFSTPYFQILGGFNYETTKNWAPIIELSSGYAMKWRDNIIVDLGLLAKRSYSEAKTDPNLSLFLNITMELNHKLLPFL